MQLSVFQLALLSMLQLVNCLDDGLFTPEDIYVSDPYCGPVVWNGYGMMFPTYKSCMVNLLSTSNHSDGTTKKREILSNVVSAEVYDYLELYNVTDSFLSDLLHIAPDDMKKRTYGAVPAALPSSVHRYIYSVVKHTTSTLWWRFKELLYDTSVNVFHFVDTSSSLLSTAYTIADYYKSSGAVKSCSSIVRLVAKNGSLLIPPEQGGSSDPNNPAYFYAHIKPHTSNNGKCDTKTSKGGLQAAVEDALNEFYDRQAVAACMRIRNSGAWYGEIRLVYISYKSQIAFSDIDCEPA